MSILTQTTNKIQFNPIEFTNELQEFVHETMQPYFRTRPEYFRHYIEIEVAVKSFLSLPLKDFNQLRNLMDCLLTNYLLAFGGSLTPNQSDKSYFVASFLRLLGIIEQFFSPESIKNIATNILLKCTRMGYVNQEAFLLLNKKKYIDCKSIDDGIIKRLNHHDVNAREFSRFLQRAYGPQKVDQFCQNYPNIYQYMLMNLRDF